MDWKDELKSQASDKAQSKAVDSVAKSQGDTAASLANDGIDAAKAGDPKILAQKQKLAAQQRAREVAERKYAEGKTSAANKVADQYGNTVGKATGEAIDAARNGDRQGFENQQKENAKDRAQDTAGRKLEEQLSGNSAAKAQQAATMSAEEKRDLLKDMDISYTSKQTQTQEELIAASAAAKSMSVDDKRELLKDMEISYTSKPVPVQEQSTNATASPGQNASASIASQATANTQNTSPHNSQNQPQSSSAAGTDQTKKPKGPVQQKAPIAIGALNTLVIDHPANNIVLQDETGQPMANTRYLIEVKGRKIEGVTDGQGEVIIDLPEGMKEIFITFWPDPNDETELLKIALELGTLKKANDPIGTQQRLANFGYLQGNIDGDIGPVTQANLKALQMSQNLTMSGDIDRSTEGWLQENEGIA